LAAGDPSWPGVSGSLWIEAGGSAVRLMAGTLHSKGPYAFVDVDADLSDYAGRTVNLVLVNEGPACAGFSNDLLWDLPRVEYIPGAVR